MITDDVICMIFFQQAMRWVEMRRHVQLQAGQGHVIGCHVSINIGVYTYNIFNVRWFISSIYELSISTKIRENVDKMYVT